VEGNRVGCHIGRNGIGVEEGYTLGIQGIKDGFGVGMHRM